MSLTLESKEKLPDGIVTGLSFADYQQTAGINQSTLKRFLKQTTSELSGSLSEQAFILGSAGHCLLLEPELFEKTYARAPAGLSRRGTHGKRRWAEHEARHPGITFLSANIWDRLMSARKAFLAHPEIRPWMDSGNAEASLFWREPEHGLYCKGRLDWLNLHQRLILDLKFTRNAGIKSCGDQIKTLHHDLQAAWYSEGIRVLEGWSPRFILVFIEALKPHRITVYPLDEKELDSGTRKIATVLSTHLLQLQSDALVS